MTYWVAKAYRQLEADGEGVSGRRLAKVKREFREVMLKTLDGPHRPILEAVAQAEVPIRGLVEGILLGGRPDARGIIDERSFCIDYKLSNTASGQGSRQIAFYSLIVPIERAWVFYPKLGLMKPVRLVGPRMVSLLEKVKALVKGVESGDRTPNVRNCPRCLYKEVCDKKVLWRSPWTRE